MSDKAPSPPPVSTPQASQASTPAASGSAAPASSQSGDRATTFQSVEGGNEQRSGAVLMVEAYALVWLFILAWVAMLWMRQRKLDARLDGLEAAIDRAERARSKSKD